MKLNILIVDDDETDLHLIEKTTSDILRSTEHDINLKCANSINFYTLNSTYNLVILDIDMPGLSGFELAEKFARKNPDTAIMFCTSHDDFVFNSFQYNVFYFIRKSSLAEDMTNALRKYLNYLPGSTEYYYLHDRLPIPFSHILYFETGGNDVFIYTDLEDQYYKDHISLSRLEEKLPDGMFIRPSRSHLINLCFVENLSNNTITLKNRQKFLIVKNRRKLCEIEFMRWQMR